MTDPDPKVVPINRARRARPDEFVTLDINFAELLEECLKPSIWLDNPRRLRLMEEERER